MKKAQWRATKLVCELQVKVNGYEFAHIGIRKRGDMITALKFVNENDCRE